MPDTINRLQIPNPAFEFEGENNAYLLQTDDVNVLVDTGVDTPETRNILLREFDRAGVAVADVGAIYLTHWHPDHAGLAGFVQEVSGAPVHVHEWDAGLVRHDANAVEDLMNQYVTLFDEWGLPAEKRNEVFSLWDADREASANEATFAAAGGGAAPMVEAFTDGDRLRYGGIELEVKHLPGHTAGQSGFVFIDEEHRGVFTGDALLPEYTSNIGGADPRVEHSLEQHVQSLAFIADGAFSRACPGHRDSIDDPTARARDVLNHHQHRAHRILDLLEGNGSMSTWGVSEALFGDLENVHIFIGPGETDAHLGYLAQHGFVERTADGYRRTDRPATALETVFDIGAGT